MPESAWKFLFYLGAWSYSAYLLFGTDYPFFHDPPSVFYGRDPPSARKGQEGEGSVLNSEKGMWGEPDTDQTSLAGLSAPGARRGGT